MLPVTQRSLSVFPAACNGEFNLPVELATVLSHGKGYELWDVEGRRFLDFSMGWGSVLLGHARPEVVRATQEQLRRGSNFAYVNEPALQLGERLIEASPACEAIRFCSSGTEATMYCLRLARAFTGRHKVLKFEGAYHGAHDIGVASLFPDPPPDFPRPDSSSAGVSPAIADGVLVAPYNNLCHTEQIVAAHADDLAAIIVEPLQRCLTPAAGFLPGLRNMTRKHGIVLVFDEVVTGFRLAYGGAQEYYGVVPDLVAYGKALGGGMPIGAFGGRRSIVDLVREDRMGHETYVWVASTLGGNPVSAAAALATLRILNDAEPYVHLRHLGNYLRCKMREVFASRGIPAQVIGDGPLAQMVFTAEEVRDYRSVARSDKTLARKVMLALFERRVFLNPMGTKLYLSLAHDQPACDEFCDTLSAALDDVL